MQAVAMLLGMILGGAGCMGGMVGAQMRWGHQAACVGDWRTGRHVRRRVGGTGYRSGSGEGNSMSTEQEQLARFLPALDALEHDAMAINTVTGFHNLVDKHVDLFDGGERLVCLNADGSYAIVLGGSSGAIETPDRLVLEASDLGDVPFCIGDLRRQLYNAVLSPEI